jgi:hypothetical protein
LFPCHVIRVMRIAKILLTVGALDQFLGVVTTLLAFWHVEIDLEL